MLAPLETTVGIRIHGSRAKAGVGTLNSRNRLGAPKLNRTSSLLARVAATCNNARSAISAAVRAGPSSSGSAVASGRNSSFTLAITMQSNSSPLTLCMVARRTPLEDSSGESASSISTGRSAPVSSSAMTLRSARVRATTHVPRSDSPCLRASFRNPTSHAACSSLVSKNSRRGSGPCATERTPRLLSEPPSRSSIAQTVQEARGPPTSFLGRAVVQAKLPGATANFDAVSPQYPR